MDDWIAPKSSEIARFVIISRLGLATRLYHICEPTAHRSVPKGSFPLPHRRDEWPWEPPAVAGLGVG
jgi:hypothetical protein